MAPTKPILHPLQTPKSTSFPSEIHSTSVSARPDMKGEEVLSTPITPPLAYTEFLKALTPVFNTPASPGMSFPKYPIEKTQTPTSQPSTATSVSFPGDAFIKSATLSPNSPVAPVSAKSFSGRRRLRISTAKASGKTLSPTTDSPMSALSATTVCSPFSPSDWKLRYSDMPRTSSSRHVSVRQVVTRTVTYKRTPLDAPPKGKRRKTSDSK